MDCETGVFSDEIDITALVTGIAWADGNLWVTESNTKAISMLDPKDGTTITSIPAPTKNPMGLSFDGKYLWCSDRIKDKIYAIDPVLKDVLFSFDSPGKHPWGLTWDGKMLWNIDYEDRKIYAIKVRDPQKYIIYDKKKERLNYSSTVRNYGPGRIASLDFYVAIPEQLPTQKFLRDIHFLPTPKEILTDQYNQKIAHYVFKDIPSGQEKKVTYTIDAEICAIRYYIYPDEVGSSNDIPQEIRDLYLKDESKYDIYNPYIQELTKKIIGDEKNLYRKARRLYDYLIANMEYKLEGGWNAAPTVLKRGTGSCSEYTFSYIALCRAAGIPARFLGSTVVRGDDASFDDVFHRWCEIYLPPFGWIPIDADAGDQELPADQAEAFGGYKNRFIITTKGGGESPYLKWSYNCVQNIRFEEKCKIMIEDLAEWEPIEEIEKK